jgi:hypothetical protein
LSIHNNIVCGVINHSWSSIVSGNSPTGSISVRSDISLIQAQNELLTQKVQEMAKQYEDMKLMMEEQQHLMREQEAKLIAENEKRRLEYEQREKELVHQSEERDQQLKKMMELNQRLMDNQEILSEQIKLSVSSSENNSSLLQMAVKKLEQTRAEQHESESRQRQEMRDWISDINLQIRGKETRGYKRQNEEFHNKDDEDYNTADDVIMDTQNANISNIFTPNLHSTIGNTNDAENKTPMDITPQIQLESLRPRSSLQLANTRLSEAQTPLRGNSMLINEFDNDELENIDAEDSFISIDNDKNENTLHNPAGPPDHAGQRL